MNIDIKEEDNETKCIDLGDDEEKNPVDNPENLEGKTLMDFIGDTNTEEEN